MKHYRLFIIAVAFISFSGCKKFVEVDTPDNLLVTTNVFENNETAIAAMTGIYYAMGDRMNAGYRLAVLTGIAGDELTNYYNTNAPLYVNNQRPIDAPTNTTWNDAFNYIYQANAVFEGCNNSSQLSEPVKRQLMGEALFVRSFWYFYLVNLYGDLPILTGTDYNVNAKAPRAPKSQVYDRLIEDLIYAQANLNEKYVAANSVSPTSERVRPNSYAAKALLSRAYLYVEKYKEAEQMATAVLNNKGDYDTVKVNDVFLKGSKEALWQLMKSLPNNNINTYEGRNFILTKLPANSFSNGTAISSGMASSFEAGDKRKLTWINKWTDKTVTPNVDYYYPFKYRVQNGADVTEHSVVLRLAELYLIRAEARAMTGDLAGGLADLDVIRKRAGLTLVGQTNPGIAKDELLIAIQKERQNELFTEWGHRWLDMKRTGTIDIIMTTVAPYKGATWKTEQQLWPIPQQSLDNGINLKQNPGYSN